MIIVKLDCYPHRVTGNKNLYITKRNQVDFYTNNVSLIDLIKTVDNQGHYAESGNFESLYSVFNNEVELEIELNNCRKQCNDDELEIIEELQDELVSMHLKSIYFIYAPKTTNHLKITEHDLFDGVYADNLDEIVTALVQQDNYYFCVKYNDISELLSEAKILLDGYQDNEFDNQDEIFCLNKIINIAKNQNKETK